LADLHEELVLQHREGLARSNDRALPRMTSHDGSFVVPARIRTIISDECPSIYKAENGDYVIQGWQLDADTSAKLHNLARDETAVRIPASLITDLAAAAIGH
jgi:hypothetical protein